MTLVCVAVRLVGTTYQFAGDGIVVQFVIDGVIHHNSTAALDYVENTAANTGYVKVGLKFEIPAAPVLTAHVQSLVFHLPGGSVIDTEHFSYRSVVAQ